MPLKITQDGDSFYATPEGEGAEPIQLDMTGYVPQATLAEKYLPKSHFESEIQRRVSAAKKGLVSRDELLADDGILDDVVGTHRDALVERLGVKPTSEADIVRLREQIHTKEVAPLQGQIETLTGTIGKLRERGFAGDFGGAARAVGVDDEMVELIQGWARGKVGYHEESDSWVVMDAEGNPALTTADLKGRDHPYQTVEDLLRDVHDKGERKAWFKARQRTGSDIMPGGGGDITLDQWDKMNDTERTKLYRSDHATWQAMIEAQRQRGEARIG